MRPYIENAIVSELRHVEQPPLMNVKLFGESYIVYDDSWRQHLHIVCTYRCNAKCGFCIEKDKEDNSDEKFLEGIKSLLSEMHREGILKTVSITGGEPLLYPHLRELIKIIKHFPIFLTVNTNGYNLIKNVHKLEGVDFVNVSRHYIKDDKNNLVFKSRMPSLIELKKARNHLDGKLRIQAVVNEETNVSDFIRLAQSGYCEDVSIRSLMIEGNHPPKLFYRYQKLIRDCIKSGGELIEQEIQDYYIYETFKLSGVSITFSYSDMYMLQQCEKKEHSNFMREFVVTPNGAISGSWFPEVKKIRF